MYVCVYVNHVSFRRWLSRDVAEDEFETINFNSFTSINISISKTTNMGPPGELQYSDSATGWTTGFDSRQGTVFVFSTRTDWPWGPSRLLTNGFRGSFLRGKAAGARSWPTTHHNLQQSPIRLSVAVLSLGPIHWLRGLRSGPCAMDYSFESRLGYGCLSVCCVVLCKVEPLRRAVHSPKEFCRTSKIGFEKEQRRPGLA
jgi:hypothetical protein